MFASQKDIILSRIGRIISLIIYSSLYILNEYFLKHNIVFDGALITGLLSGSALTLTLSKGIYTMLHQYCEKKTLFERLEYVSTIIDKMSETTDEDLTKEEKIENFTKENKWILTNKKEK